MKSKTHKLILYILLSIFIILLMDSLTSSDNSESTPVWLILIFIIVVLRIFTVTDSWVYLWIKRKKLEETDLINKLKIKNDDSYNNTKKSKHIRKIIVSTIILVIVIIGSLFTINLLDDIDSNQRVKKYEEKRIIDFVKTSQSILGLSNPIPKTVDNELARTYKNYYVTRNVDYKITKWLQSIKGIYRTLGWKLYDFEDKYLVGFEYIQNGVTYGYYFEKNGETIRHIGINQPELMKHYSLKYEDSSVVDELNSTLLILLKCYNDDLSELQTAACQELIRRYKDNNGVLRVLHPFSQAVFKRVL